MKYPMQDFRDGMEMMIRDNKCKTVVVFCSPLSDVKHRVRITRRLKNEDDFVVTFGKPNYVERAYLALCKKVNRRPRHFWFKLWRNK